MHFPAKYVPLGVAYTKRKMVEHGIVEKAGGAVLAMRTHAKTALQKGLETDMGKKGLELKIKMGGMASQLASSSAVSGGVAMADSIRLKVGDKLRAQGGGLDADGLGNLLANLLGLQVPDSSEEAGRRGTSVSSSSHAIGA